MTSRALYGGARGLQARRLYRDSYSRCGRGRRRSASSPGGAQRPRPGAHGPRDARTAQSAHPLSSMVVAPPAQASPRYLLSSEQCIQSLGGGVSAGPRGRRSLMPSGGAGLPWSCSARCGRWEMLPVLPHTHPAAAASATARDCLGQQQSGPACLPASLPAFAPSLAITSPPSLPKLPAALQAAAAAGPLGLTPPPCTHLPPAAALPAAAADRPLGSGFFLV